MLVHDARAQTTPPLRVVPINDSPLGGWFSHDPQSRFVLELSGRMRAATEGARRMLEDGVVGLSGGKLQFGSVASNRLLERALRRTVADRNEQQRMVLRRLDGAWGAADLYAPPKEELALLTLHNEASPTSNAMEAVVEAFDLTRVEGLVLSGLSVGRCPKAVAQDLAISEHTVRSHLRSIYAKLGVHGLPNTLRLVAQLLTA